MSPERMPERVSSLEEWVKGHEALCAQRYGDLKDTVTWLVRWVFAMLVAIVAWLAIQLWAGAQARLYTLEREHREPPPSAQILQTERNPKRGDITTQPNGGRA